MDTTLLLAFSLTVLAAASAQRLRENCPDIPAKDGFDINSYMGDWYEAEKFTTIFELGLKCVSANYTLNRDGSVRFTNSGIRRWFGDRSTAVAIATIPDPNMPAKLSVKFHEAMEPGPYWVVETDYDTFSLVYSCSSYLFDIVHAELAWILTRERGFQLDDSVRQRLYNRLLSYDINPARFNAADQTGCDTHLSNSIEVQST